MNKRGAQRSSMKTAFLASMIIVSALIIVSMFAFIYGAINDTTFWRNYYAKDVGLMMETSLAGRGQIDITYDFSHSSKPLVMTIKDNFIEMREYKPEKNEGEVDEPTSFRYAKDNYNKIFDSWIDIKINSQYFRFFKNYNSLDVLPIFNDKICPDFNTKASKSSIKIFVNAESSLKGTLDVGFERNGFLTTNDPETADLILVIINSDENNLYFFEKKQDEKHDKLSCLINKEILNLNFANNFFAENTEQDLFKGLGLGLLIHADYNDQQMDFAKALIQGVTDYYD
jgi:hypothetical protein